MIIPDLLILFRIKPHGVPQMSHTQMSYEHLKFSYGACSPMLYLCLEQEWLVPSTLRPLPRVTGTATLAQGMGAVYFSRHRISDHC